MAPSISLELNHLCILYMLSQLSVLGGDYSVCDHPDNWKSHEISLVHLQEVEIKGLIGTDCELRFIQYLLKGAEELQKLTLSSNPGYFLKSHKDAAFKLVSLLGSEMWKCDSYLLHKWERLFRIGDWKAYLLGKMNV